LTRIRIIERAEMNAEQGRVYDEAKAKGNPVGGPYYAYIRFPRLMSIAQELGTCLRESPLSGRERQIAVLATIRHWDSKYPWTAQVRASLAAGVDQPVIDAINAKKAPPLDNAREKLAYQVATELLKNHAMSDATYAAAAKAFSEQELVALVAVVGQFSMVSNTANAFDITAPADAPTPLAG
jgi:4-carboxymuconolactone decarboxylase